MIGPRGGVELWGRNETNQSHHVPATDLRIRNSLLVAVLSRFIARSNCLQTMPLPEICRSTDADRVSSYSSCQRKVLAMISFRRACAMRELCR